MKQFKIAIILIALLTISSISLFSQGKSGQYELFWSDEFDYQGLPDSTKWNYDVGGHGWGNDELQYYTDKRLENASVKDGYLTITARKEEYKGKQFTSARLITKDKGDFLYGRFELRAKLPRGRGTWPAGWMLASDWSYGAWPESGEIDILEHVGYDMGVQHVSFHSLNHYWKTGTQKTATIKLDKIDSTFYTYAVEWTPDSLKAFVDDSCYLAISRDVQNWKVWPFNKPFHLLLNIAVGGAWGSAQGIDESIWPQQLTYDFVRVYKLKEKPDYITPSAPENLRSVNAANRVSLLWEPSYDNYSVKEYIIYVNKKEVGRTPLHSFEIASLKPNKSLSIKVEAIDYQGNVSNPATINTKTTQSNTILIPSKIEAENYSAQKGSIVEPCNASATSVDVCWYEPNDILEYEINVPESKEYTLQLQAATERVDCLVEVLDASGAILSEIKVDNTRSWQVWKPFISKPFKLAKGTQKIKLLCKGDRLSLDWLEIK